MENASQTFLEAVRKSLRAIRHALQAAKPDQVLLTRAERLQDADNMIRTLLRKGAAIKAIVRATGYARKAVRQVARGG